MEKAMKKYIETAKIMFKAQIIYRFDVMLTAVGTVWRILFARILWGAVFAGRDSVGGFTLRTMLSYYVVSSFLASIEMSWGVSGEVSARIRGGTFSKYMVIPTQPEFHFIAQSFGASCYYAIFAAAAAVLCASVFRINLSVASDPAAAACAVVMVPVGLAFMVSYHYLIGILAFKFQDVGFFRHLQGSLVSFFTGAIVPLTLLPEGMMGFLRFMPFTYVTYMPATLITGRASAGEGLFGLAVLSVWTAGMISTCRFAYGRLRVKYDGVGI